MIDRIMELLGEVYDDAINERNKYNKESQRDGWNSWQGFANGVDEAMTIIQELVEEYQEPGDIDSDVGYDPYLGMVTDEV